MRGGNDKSDEGEGKYMYVRNIVKCSYILFSFILYIMYIFVVATMYHGE